MNGSVSGLVARDAVRMSRSVAGTGGAANACIEPLVGSAQQFETFAQISEIPGKRATLSFLGAECQDRGLGVATEHFLILQPAAMSADRVR